MPGAGPGRREHCVGNKVLWSVLNKAADESFSYALGPVPLRARPSLPYTLTRPWAVWFRRPVAWPPGYPGIEDLTNDIIPRRGAPVRPVCVPTPRAELAQRTRGAMDMARETSVGRPGGGWRVRTPRGPAWEDGGEGWEASGRTWKLAVQYRTYLAQTRAYPA